MRRCSVIYAATPSGGIGCDGGLPWKLPSDMAYFARVTTGVTAAGGVTRNAVVMGRKTWASIPAKFRPLKGRLNIVLSTSDNVREAEGIPEDVLVASSLTGALSLLSESPYASGIERVFVIGGAAAFTEALSGAGDIELEAIYATRVLADNIVCDVFVPAQPDDAAYALDELTPRAEENGIGFQFAVYRSRALFNLRRSTLPFQRAVIPRHEEWQYLDAIRDICATGVRRGDRTGTGTISKFGTTSRWSLRDDSMPLLTTKKVFWRAVAEELLWFISGSTNAKTLQDKGVKIWDGNASREFLDKSGLGHREVGDLGPVYGFQWRHFGAAYTDMHADYSNAGYDQLAKVIETIKKNPDDRRIILSAWNPCALAEMALPPCHMFAQFYVADGELSCAMYQRSGDMGLGVPFNIASYALLTRLIAHVCRLKSGELIHVIGDAHVYSNHVGPLQEQLGRTPRTFPTLKIDATITDIDAIRFEHLTLEGYDPHPPIKMDMSV